MNRKKGFSLIELMVVVAIMAIMAVVAISSIFGGCAGVISGTEYMEEREATIEVSRLYPIASKTGTSYRCFARVLDNPSEDENLSDETTFEIVDSIMKGQFTSADLYGKLREGEVFHIIYYGIRAGWASQFPKIINVEWAMDDQYDD